MLIAGLLGGLALTLASVGVFGVFAYIVQRRTREIGIRMALGARPAHVIRLVIGGSSRALSIGLCVGVPAALGCARLLEGNLYGISPFDPLAYLGVAVMLAVAGIGATYVPARRATRVDPMSALRCE